jgi:hypothetical protein
VTSISTGQPYFAHLQYNRVITSAPKKLFNFFHAEPQAPPSGWTEIDNQNARPTIFSIVPVFSCTSSARP